MRRQHFLALTLGALCLLGVSAAHAQFLSMDRQRGASLMGVRADLSVYDDIRGQSNNYGGNSDTYIRTEIYGQYTGQLIGYYGHLHLAHWLPEDGENQTVLSNIELGGFMTRRFTGNNVILRVGLVLPTAQDDDGTGKHALVQNAWGRLSDMTVAVPKMTALRLSASPYVRGGAVFFRADFGVDFVLPSGADLTIVPRGNLGVGADFDWIILTGEFVNTLNIKQFLGSGFLHAFTFSVGHGILRAGFTVPLREDYELTVFTINIESGI
ncbi:MAG: hypothetical protein KC613_12470 [Myxococcales bacterium]|nr:hypothetical protein [Myxococcales bacterium]MCB9523609.1 hypothetical protein [Myxococcales bacterium]